MSNSTTRTVWAARNNDFEGALRAYPTEPNMRNDDRFRAKYTDDEVGTVDEKSPLFGMLDFIHKGDKAKVEITVKQVS